jgi:hypothetical protein
VLLREVLLRGAVPVLVRVRVRLAEAPMAMLPKLRAEGAMTRCDWTPMPVTGTLMGNEEREVAMARVLVRVPVAVGVKVICSVQVAAGARVLPGVGQVPVTV